MVEASADMKVITNKNSLHSRKKTKQTMKREQNKLSRSPNEADLNKRRSLKNRGTMKLNINLKHSFNRGTTG